MVKENFYRQTRLSFPSVTMHKTLAPQLSTVELIDALEAGIAAIRSRNGHSAPDVARAAAPSELRAEMERAEVSAIELAKAIGVADGDLNAWIVGHAEPPEWALAATRLVALLPPSARRKLLTEPRGNGRAAALRTHPFSRIEDL
jgi:DNA-binding transcriptional regulator YiaG